MRNISISLFVPLNQNKSLPFASASFSFCLIHLFWLFRELIIIITSHECTCDDLLWQKKRKSRDICSIINYEIFFFFVLSLSLIHFFTHISYFVRMVDHFSLVYHLVHFFFYVYCCVFVEKTCFFLLSVSLSLFSFSVCKF